MSKLLRALVAGYGAKKLGNRWGCGCFGTVAIFILLWVLLGQCHYFQ